MLRLNKLYTFYSLLKYTVMKVYKHKRCMCPDMYATMLIMELCEKNVNVTYIVLWPFESVLHK